MKHVIGGKNLSVYTDPPVLPYRNSDLQSKVKHSTEVPNIEKFWNVEAAEIAQLKEDPDK